MIVIYIACLPVTGVGLLVGGHLVVGPGEDAHLGRGGLTGEGPTHRLIVVTPPDEL